MKVIGLLLIVLISTAIGASFYDNDRKKVRTLSLLCSFIDELYTGIRYTGSTVEEVILCCTNNPIYDSLKFLKQIKNEAHTNGVSGETVKRAVLTNVVDMNLKKEELMPLLAMADKLGITDTEGQLQMLDVCRRQISEIKARHIKHCETYGKVYISLGLLLGLGTAVILA